MEQNVVTNVSAKPAIELGEKLRLERQRKKLSIGEVAERLKLPARQIEALENGHYDGLPELVFVRGFLRTYGRLLELDDQELTAYLDKVLPQDNGYAERGIKADSADFHNREAKKPFPTWIFGLLAVAVIAVGVYAWQDKSKSENAKQEADSKASAGLGEVAAPNIDTDNVSVVPMPSEAHASSASQPVIQADTGIAANELLVKVRYRSKLVIKDKNGRELVNQVVPANSEHRFSGGAPYNVWIGFAKGAKVVYGSQDVPLNKHMVDNKTASLTAGQ